jgi:xanthine dehydrogenase YagS FAD-binding subunit
MRPITFQRAASPEEAAHSIATLKGADFLAGGTTLLDLMKLDVERPSHVIDINDIAAMPKHAAIDVRDGGVHLGAFAKMADVARHDVIKTRYPIIAQSLMLAASPQIRNMATLGGNVLQRTRCPYFRDTSYEACNKRNPGSGCSAVDGFNRQHAVLGVNEFCIASYPGDFAQALIALDAQVQLIRDGGKRTIAFSALHRDADDNPANETTLQPGELITGFDIPAGDFRRSMYLKVRDRTSYAFAAASAAVALQMQGREIKDARIALGGVAYKPWRAREAEQFLIGKDLTEDVAKQAARAAFANATPHEHNGYKVRLGQETLVRALLETAKLEV